MFTTGASGFCFLFGVLLAQAHFSKTKIQKLGCRKSTSAWLWDILANAWELFCIADKTCMLLHANILQNAIDGLANSIYNMLFIFYNLLHNRYLNSNGGATYVDR